VKYGLYFYISTFSLLLLLLLLLLALAKVLQEPLKSLLASPEGSQTFGKCGVIHVGCPLLRVGRAY